MRTSAKIRKANKASAEQLATALEETDPGMKQFSFSLKTSADLVDDQREQMWNMFEENMYKFYETSSFGWDPQMKKAEMFDQLSRFIIVCHKDSCVTGQGSYIVAYTIFRFDAEEGQDVVYCYELQVSKDARRCGLGKRLTQMLQEIGTKWGMEKLMLTVFRANDSALCFYESIGFAVDETSPDFTGSSGYSQEVAFDYSILSIRIP
ncbi:acyl-CoA N-acyltransferase [Phlebopus sp. FC_14]|nr:acyl-CoA N-acyltransferase [Phlebopus sp. FC_14]